APDSLRPVMRPGIVPDLVELHRFILTASAGSALTRLAPLDTLSRIAERGDPARQRRVGEGALLLFHHPNEVFHFVDHTPDRRRVFENAPAVPLVQTQTLEGRFLVRLPSDRTTDLLDGDRRAFALHHAFSRGSASRRP